jgi:putative two-component system response regulator
LGFPVLDQLEAARAQSDASDLKVALSKLAVEINGQYQRGSAASADFMPRAIAAVKSFSGTEFAELRINCLIDASHSFYLSGQTFDAIDPANAAVTLAGQADVRPLLRKALTLLGMVHADTGNISVAVECYDKALRIAQEIRDTDAECAVWINLGVALLYAAQYGDAIACLEHVISLAGTDPALQRYRGYAFSNIALCCIHLDDYRRGIKAVETCIKESPEPRTSAELVARVLRESYYIRLLLELGDVERAGQRAELARKFAMESRSARADIAAAVADGLYQIHAGNIDVGISRLTNTLERARLMRSMLRDTLNALVKAYERIGQPDRALVYLREMIEAMRASQQDNALRHLNLHLERLPQDVVGDPKVQLERQEAALQGKIAQQELFRSRIEMLERLAVTAELRDDSTGEHSYRVGKMSSLLASEFGCDEDVCFMIELAARLHDIGKIGVPDAILLKPDKLNSAETQIMRTHTTVGAELLSKSNIAHMQMAEEIARHHHEWWDGTGYPGNLSGSAIPLSARITALADVFDALTHKRPYKVAWPIDAALDEISHLKGRQFDPQLADLFIVLVTRLRRDYIDIDSFLGQAAHGSPFLQARARIWNALHRSHDRESGSDSRLDMQR